MDLRECENRAVSRARARAAPAAGGYGLSEGRSRNGWPQGSRFGTWPQGPVLGTRWEWARGEQRVVGPPGLCSDGPGAGGETPADPGGKGGTGWTPARPGRGVRSARIRGSGRAQAQPQAAHERHRGERRVRAPPQIAPPVEGPGGQRKAHEQPV